MKPGGIFRVTCPDADLFYLSLQLGRKEYWDSFRRWFGTRDMDWGATPHEEFLLYELATERLPYPEATDRGTKISAGEVRRAFEDLGKVEFLDWLTGPCAFKIENPGEHVNWWNGEKIMASLAQSGFPTIWRSGYGASLAAPMQNTRHFDSTHPLMSVYVEAAKA